jgi:hypothetical protein
VIDMQVRPVEAWPGGKRTPASERRTSPFNQRIEDYDERSGRVTARTRKVPVAQTLAELRFELGQIDCRRAVIEAGFRAWDIGANGWPLARARTPEDPGVVLRVLESRYGELTYPCDTFTTWEANIRAITLALEALRKVDRYGVTKRGEQYAGWKRLAARGTNTLTAEAAAAIIVARGNGQLDNREAKAVAVRALSDLTEARGLYRQAQRATHPDAGGSTEAFQDVERAGTVLAAHFGVERL